MRRLLAVAVLVLVGCGSGVGGGTAVPLDQLPPGMLDTAKKTLPNVKFDTAYRLANGNVEVRGKDAKGKVREIEFKPDGSVEGVE
jgi:hypothetical protein